MKFIYFCLLSLLVLTLSACDNSEGKSSSFDTPNQATDIKKSSETSTYIHSEDNAIDSKDQASKPESSTKHENSNEKIYQHAFLDADSLIFHDLFYLRNEGISYTLDQVEVGKDIPPGEYVVTYYEGRSPYWNVIINGIKHERVSDLNKIYITLKPGYIIEAEGYAFTPKDKFNENAYKVSPELTESIDLETL